MTGSSSSARRKILLCDDSALVRSVVVHALGALDVDVTTIEDPRELARNIFHYAKTGTISLKKLGAPRPGLEIVAIDQGPGIRDVKHVMSGSYRSTTGMGKGLLGARRLVDVFEIDTAPGRGTRVMLRKYVR